VKFLLHSHDVNCPNLHNRSMVRFFTILLLFGRISTGLRGKSHRTIGCVWKAGSIDLQQFKLVIEMWVWADPFFEAGQRQKVEITRL
jgi:hypothetical protein